MKKVTLMNNQKFELTDKEVVELIQVSKEKGLYFSKRIQTAINTTSISSIAPLEGELNRDIYIHMNKKNGQITKYAKMTDGTFCEIYNGSLSPAEELPKRMLDELFKQDDFYTAESLGTLQSYSQALLLKDTKQKQVC